MIPPPPEDCTDVSDWKQVVSVAETALTLTPEQRAVLLAGDALDSEVAREVERLITRMRAPAGFMATSDDGESGSASLLAPGDRVGVWRIVAPIGSGGMGEVYRAERADGLYEQTVALKLMHVSDARRVERFELERKRLAMMEHPGISRIIDGGVSDDGRPFMAMEFVDGLPIDRWAREHQLDRTARLRLFRDLCDAVGHAHSKLVLHRDIKPDNVLVDERGHVRLIDFGIASDLDDEGGEPGPLTLAYAAPEQLTGDAVSVATDVHAMGVLLHVLLTGDLPERQPDASLRPDATRLGDADAAAIVGRALALEPSARYASASALGADIRALLGRLPVAARDGGAGYRTLRFVQRNPLATAFGAAFVLALSAGLVTSLSFARAANEEADRANEALREARWLHGRTEAWLKAQEAYADVLQRAFGGDDDNAERLSAVMMSRLAEAMARREEDPLRAAALSYAIGRSFYIRGDVRRALEVFDPWMDERFGPQPLIDIGEEVYALMLTDGSRTDEAEPILRRLVATHDTGFEITKADLFNYAFKLARITQDRADIDTAERLVLELIETDTDPFSILFHHNQLGFLRLAKADRDGAIDAFAKTVAVFDENPNLVAYGRDIGRLNLAGLVFAWQRDADEALGIVEQILTEDVPLKGESVQKGRALALRALIHDAQGRHDAAVADARAAVELMIRFSGEGTATHLAGLSVQALVEAGAGDDQGAAAALAAMSALTAELPPNDARHAQVAMTELVTALITKGTAPPIESVIDRESLMASVRANSQQLYFYQRLVDAGAAEPP